MDHKVISFCGLCSPLSRVHDFEEEWQGLLHDYELDFLTMKRALRRTRRLSPRIDKQSATERNESLKLFAICIRKHFEVGVAITVDVQAYRGLSSAAKKKIGGSEDPHYLAFLCGIMAPSKRLRDEDKISLICDDDEGTAWNGYRLYRRVRRVGPYGKDKIIALTFADDRAFLPLQAADFLSSLARLEALKQFHHEYYEYVPLFQNLTQQGSPTGIKWVIGSFGQEKLKQIGKGLETAY
jgi:hypothetical protein